MNEFFTEIYEAALLHASEIFSFLSLIGTIAVSYFYKKGLLPSVKSALSALGGLVGGIKETSDKQREEQTVSARQTDERLCEFERLLGSYGKTLENMESRLIAEREVYDRLEKTNVILSGQIDMLYGVFVSASLPEYQKEQLGAQYNRLRALITEGEVQKNESKD
jgi:hypothetical protein